MLAMRVMTFDVTQREIGEGFIVAAPPWSSNCSAMATLWHEAHRKPVFLKFVESRVELLAVLVEFHQDLVPGAGKLDESGCR